MKSNQPDGILTILVLSVLVGRPSYGATTIISDDYNVTGSGSGFALNEGVNTGINPPATRLAGTAKDELRYIKIFGGKADSTFTITDNKFNVARDGNEVATVTLSSGSGAFDFSTALGTLAAKPANKASYDITIKMRNRGGGTGTARFSFAFGSAAGSASVWDFGLQVYRTDSAHDYYTIQKRIRTAASGLGADLNSPITTTAAGTFNTEVSFLIRVTDAGAESSAFNSRIQVSMDGGSTWFYDTATDGDLSNGWRLSGAGRYVCWDIAGTRATYDDFSIMPYRSPWTGGGGDDNWSTCANWGGYAAPAASGDDVVFAGTTRLTPLMQADYSVGKVQFNSGAGSFTLGAAAGKTLTVTGEIIQNSANAQTLNLPVSIAATRTVNTAGGNLTIGGAISGEGGIAKSGNHTLILSGANSYSGSTTVSAGTLLVNGAIGSGAVTVAEDATLGGSGTIGGNTTVQSGGTLSAGDAGIGTLTISGSKHVTLNSGSTTSVEVNRSGPSSDLVTGIGTFTMGGTLEVANTGAALAAADEFTLFSATTKAGEFAAISPAKPDSNDDLAWDTPHLKANGILRVHRSPGASDKTVTRPRDLSVKIRWSDLFDGTDADNDPVVLESFTASVKGATITSNATYLFYSLPGSNDDDEFHYTATDNRGGKRTRKITVQVSTDPVTGQAQQITVVGGTATVGFAGIPGARYDVQRATDASFTENLTTVLSTNAPAGGLFLLVEEPGLPQAYYRLKYPGTPAP